MLEAGKNSVINCRETVANCRGSESLRVMNSLQIVNSLRILFLVCRGPLGKREPIRENRPTKAYRRCLGHVTNSQDLSWSARSFEAEER